MKKLSLKLILLVFNLLVFSSYSQNSITVTPSDDLQALVDNNAGNTIFQLQSGTYRLVTVKPKTNNQFIGVGNVILNGSRLLTNWYKEGNLWVHDGQDQNGQQHGVCEDDYPNCQKPEDLYLNDVILHHVGSSKADVNESGEWWFDYDNDKVYMFDDPTGQKLEINTAKIAFDNRNADYVNIKNLVVEKYANPPQFGAIGGQVCGDFWTVENVESRWNHGVGVMVNNNGIVRNSHFHHNGQLGITARGKDVLFENNEVNHNLTAGIDQGWEGGGSKFSLTENLVVRNNHVHHNFGPGLWTDIQNTNTLYENNLVEYNTRMGIFHEISFKATIKCNTVRYNSNEWSPWLYGSQILVATSSDVEIFDNKVVVTATGGNDKGGNGISIIQQDRYGFYGDGDPSIEDIRYLSKNNYVHDNDITYLGDLGRSGAATDFDQANFWNNGNNRFENNTYHVPNPDINRWWWEDYPRSWSNFKAQGNDVTGVVNTDISEANIVACFDNTQLSTEIFKTKTQFLKFNNPVKIGNEINFQTNVATISKLEIFDATGKNLAVINSAFTNNKTLTTANLGIYSRGIYFIKVTSNNEYNVQKLIVE